MARFSARNIKQTRYGLVVACVFVVAVSFPASADKAEQLAELRQKIAALKQSLDADRSRHSALMNRLADSERRLGQLNIEFNESLQRQQQLETELVALAREKHDLSQSIKADKAALGEQLLTSYAMSREGYLQLLLANKNPAQLSRTMAYYDYLNRARSQRIQGLKQRVEKIKTVQNKLDSRNQELAATMAQQELSKQTLNAEKQQRKELVASLASDINSKQSQLGSLNEDEKALVRLLDELERSLADIPMDIDGSEPFAKIKGRLNWPVTGSLKTRFGASRGTGGQAWQGIEIAAEAGQQVTAVASGRVAFADWLRGFGLLIIVDHGDSYMTLYGRNQSLFQEVGDWVSVGDVIASVGNSGGAETSALYFEVRHKGQPQNPLNWIARK